MIRLVQAPAGTTGVNVVVDAAGGAFGRGAYVHATASCLAQAERGLARSFRGPVHAPAPALTEAIGAALERRARGLLSTAFRLRKVEIGKDAAFAQLAAHPNILLLVACDAGSLAHSHEVTLAVARGNAVAFGTRTILGELFGRDEVALAALTDSRIAAAFAATARTMTSLHAPSARAHMPRQRAQQHEGEACKSPEVR